MNETKKLENQTYLDKIFAERIRQAEMFPHYSGIRLRANERLHPLNSAGDSKT